MYHSILIGIDFSDTSVETVRWAVSRFPEADITLFHAIERLGVPGYLVRELGSKLEIVRERELDAHGPTSRKSRLSVASRRGWRSGPAGPRSPRGGDRGDQGRARRGRRTPEAECGRQTKSATRASPSYEGSRARSRVETDTAGKRTRRSSRPSTCVTAAPLSRPRRRGLQPTSARGWCCSTRCPAPCRPTCGP